MMSAREFTVNVCDGGQKNRNERAHTCVIR